MNYPSSFQQSQPAPQNPSQQNQGVNPAFLSGLQGSGQKFGFGGMNMNIGGGGSVTPAQLMNGQAPDLQQQHMRNMMSMGGMGMNGSNNGMLAGGGMNMMAGGMGMPAMGGMGGAGAMGINPAALTGGAGMLPNTSSNLPSNNANSLTGPSGMNMNMNMNMVLNALGMTRDQFNSLSPQERQIAASKLMAAAQHQQQRQQQEQHRHQQEHQHQQSNIPQHLVHQALQQAHQNQNQQPMSNMGGLPFPQSQSQNQQNAGPGANNNGGYYERPSSSASSHASNSMQNTGMQSMMPPPPPRPPTAQGHGAHTSRPGTALSHRSPTIPGPGSMIQQQQTMSTGAQQIPGSQHQGQVSSSGQPQRPPSRLNSGDFPSGQSQNMFNNQGIMNGFNKPSPQQTLFPGVPAQQVQFSKQNAFPQPFPSQAGMQPGDQVNHLQTSQNIPQQQITPQMQQNPYPQSQGSPPPQLGSPGPHRGAKRKVGGMESPRLGGGMNLGGSMGGMNMSGGMPHGGVGGMNVGGGISGGINLAGGLGVNTNLAGASGMNFNNGMNVGGGMSGMLSTGMDIGGPLNMNKDRNMGPPVLPRNMSQEAMGNMMNMGMGGPSHIGGQGVSMVGMPGSMVPTMNGFSPAQIQATQRQSPRPQSSNDMGGMGTGLIGEMPSRQSSLSRQSSIPPQFPPQQSGGVPQIPQQQGMRQASLPPSVIPTQPKNLHESMAVGVGLTGTGLKSSMGDLRGSVPPSLPTQSVTTTSASLAPSLTATAAASHSIIPPQGIAPSTSSSSTAGGLGGPTAPTTASQQIVPQLLPLPANVNINQKVTRVTVVPLVDSLKLIPPLNEDEVKDIQKWMKTDKEYEAVYKTMKVRMEEEAKEIFGPASAAWWEKGFLGGNYNRWRRGREGFDVRYPKKKDREGRERRKDKRREGLRLPRALSIEETHRPEQLVPIRLEFDVEHHRMRDTFVWNLNDPVVTPENFAQSIVDDYNLASSFHAIIVKSIQDQLSDYKAHSANYDGDGGELSSNEDPVRKGTLDEESAAWWESWRKRVRDEVPLSVKAVNNINNKRRNKRKLIKEEDEDRKKPAPSNTTEPGAQNLDRSMTLEEFDMMNDQAKREDMRIVIKLDIIVGSMKLDDQFEWDLENEDASPEGFAEIYAQELGLGGEFKTAIAHSIREQVQIYQKSLFLIGHPSDGSGVIDEDLKQAFLPSLTSGARPVNEVQMFTPLLNYMSDGEIDRSEKERDKDMNKRRKRNTRGRRGIALPDREPIRTYRTPGIGFPELDAATLALAVAANAPMSRRAAAAAASLTIANMVASENGTPFMPQTIPSTVQQPPPTSIKEKKPKGLFKAPAVPSNILRPRAQVVAPTPSTAADVSKLPVPLENDPPPSTYTAPPDSKAAKILTARRAKELEREAKEKEFVDGQHPNFIDGVWHCSNCGCPESIAVGRRKGPLGDKSQCGTCGKFWHRHRRPRPVEYNSDPDFHSGLKRAEAEATKTPAQKKNRGAAALRAQHTAASSTPAEASEPQTPAKSNGDVEPPSRRSPSPTNPPNDDDRAMSPVSTASSASEPPLAQRVRLNGANHTQPTTPAPAPANMSAPSSIVQTTPSGNVAATNSDGTNQSSPARATTRPQWLISAIQAMQARYSNDRFEAILRNVNAGSPEWRIRCLDCPGKLYTPGPGETLLNYEVHLKNRLHRQRVNDRINSSANS